MPARGSRVSQSLYENYKDALRRGHVAALRGKLDLAITAYGEAAEIAPDRALPHASIAGILLRTGRPAEAAEEYERALAVGPRDEVSLRGSADAMIALGRPFDAADALDRLSNVLDGAGRLPEACDAARRALELAESKDRRRHVGALVERLRQSAGDEKAELSLARALKLLEPVQVDESQVAEPVAAEPVATEPDAVEPVSAEAEVAPAATAESDQPGEANEAEPTQPADDGLAAESEPEPEPIDVNALRVAAEEALAAGDNAAALSGLLATAAAHSAAGRSVAAIDACYLALPIAPADADLHLLLAELYLERGWRPLAVDKLVLLARLAALADDGLTRKRICTLAADRLPDEARLVELCA
jgi:tetratricopeptide (TPR) repeat protein